MSGRGRVGPFLYGALFTVGVPLLLVVWARASTAQIRLPAIRVPWLGGLVALSGLGLCVAGMHALRRHGHGLPMNAYPPPAYVRQGVYRFLSHPIYVGFVLVVAGVALFHGSAGGLWLVTPATALATAALVLGYERHDLRRRFGATGIHRPLLALPHAGGAPPSAWDRASVFVLVFLPWMVAYEAVFRIGVPPDAVEGYFAFERSLPVLVWTEFFYASVYPFVGLTPFVARTRGILRHFALTALFATVVVTLIYLCVPVVAPPRPFDGDGILARMLEIERAMSHTVAAFPAFHVLWTLTAAEAWASSLTRGRALPWLWAAAITVSCITTGMHALVDIGLALVLWAGFRRYASIWDFFRRSAERVANARREWRFGPVRFISHGLYAGLAGAVGLWVAGSLSGPEARSGTAIVFVGGLLGAALWAQRLEGSPALSRPFGYFGSLAGCVAAGAVLLVMDRPVLLPLAATATAAPWIQAIGRLRCLSQGCCHGRPGASWLGIEYRLPSSRVAALAGLAGRPLHPTPLYSMLANFVIGVLVARLWSLGAGLLFIGGIYMLLGGIARFVEESYRGEPQTPRILGLRLYQWTAIVMVVAGIVMTSVTTGPAPPVTGWTDPYSLVVASLFGVATTIAMGVDFPESSRRYARLSG